MDDNTIIAFKAINDFINELGSVYGNKQKSLKCYKRLISHTQISHQEVIKKHVSIFREFCKLNREAILEKDPSKLVGDGVIIYSGPVFINMKEIFKMADKDIELVWTHLLYLSAILDPSSKAKKLIKKLTQEHKPDESSNESKFLQDIFSTVETAVKPGGNPAESISSIMSSGVFTDIVQKMSTGLESGNIDLNKLMGAVQGMVSSIDTGDDPNTSQTVGMLNNLIGNIGNGQQPNIGDILAQMNNLNSK